MSVRVLLADDHQVVVEGLGGFFAEHDDIEVVATVTDGREAVGKAKQLVPDVVVTDITMPGLNGADATREICRYCDHTRVCALTMHVSHQHVTDMLDAGVAGYVIKSAPVEDVLAAVREIAAGGTFFSAEIAESLSGSPMADTDLPTKRSINSLSQMARQVLQLVAEGKSSKEIAAILHVSKKTIDYHRQNIMSKLRLHTVADLTKFAVRQGMTPLYPLGE